MNLFLNAASPLRAAAAQGFLLKGIR